MMFEKIQKANFPRLLKTLLEKGGMSSSNLIAGFAKMGIYPFNSQKAGESGKLAAGSVLNLREDEEDTLIANVNESPQPGPSNL